MITITDKELDDYLVSHSWTRNDLTEEQLSSLRRDMEKVRNGDYILDGFLFFEKDLQQLRIQRQYSSFIVKSEEWDKLREMVARCEWTFAKSMPWCPHEYIVRGKCSLTDDEFVHFVDMQRNYGKVERWGKYITPYLYIDDYKYWTMGAPIEETIIINRAKVNIIKEVSWLYNEISRIKEDVKSKQPHKVNTLFDLEPSETGVSKILAGFFNQRQNGKYQVLESFVKYAFGEDLASLINKPIIKAEDTVEDKKRIDILVYEEGKYAIVFENKIWDAEEQDNQLANYINGMRTKEYGFEDNQIYIVYLPSTDEHGPTTKSWEDPIRKAFEERYKSVNFKEGIVNWLESEDLKIINDQSFNLSRLLFIDYLKRIFHLTETDNMENQKISELIRKELELNDNISNNIAKLTTKFNEIKECENQLERMRKEYCSELLKEWSSRLAEDFPSCNRYEECSNKRMSTGIVLPYKDNEKAIYVNLEFIDKKVCCGATYMPDAKEKREEMQSIDLIRRFWDDKNKEFCKGVDWLFYKYIELEGAYDCLKGLIKRMI